MYGEIISILKYEVLYCMMDKIPLVNNTCDEQKTGPNPDLNQVDIESLFTSSKINTGGYGIIDVSWREASNAWAVGGSGVIFESKVIAQLSLSLFLDLKFFKKYCMYVLGRRKCVQV